jgi:outer membrane protein TolC
MKPPFVLIFIAFPCLAQSNLSLREAVEAAIKSHPQLAVSANRVDVSEGLRRQASLTFNPRLILQSENTRPYSPFRFLRDTDNFAYLQQTLETGGKRQRRTDVAAAGVERAGLDRELIAFQITGRVRQFYWSAAGAQRAAQLIAENLANFQRIVDFHEIRVKQGAMAEADLLRVRLEASRMAVSFNAAQLEAERSRIHLQREMGRTEFPTVHLVDSPDPPPPVPIALAEDAIHRRPEIKVARQAVEQARLQLRLQQATARPNVDILFGYKRASGLDTMLGGVQVDLPFANRNQGNVAAASAEVRLAQSAMAAVEALIRAEVAAAQKESEIRRRQLEESLQLMRQRADELASIAEAAYREGGADLLRLLDAQRLKIETQLLYYQTLTEYRQSLAALETAMGVMP